MTETRRAPMTVAALFAFFCFVTAANEVGAVSTMDWRIRHESRPEHSSWASAHRGLLARLIMVSRNSLDSMEHDVTDSPMTPWHAELGRLIPSRLIKSGQAHHPAVATRR